MEPSDNNTFQFAIRDYFYLINNNYPEKGTLKLVGDRFKLNTTARTILFRGICEKENAEKRTRRTTGSITNKKLVIDGYNVLFTLLNYRLGNTLFIGNDDLLRDAGSLFGKIRNHELFFETISLLLNFLSKADLKHIIVYIDSPVSQSKKHAALLHGEAIKRNLNLEAKVVRSADHYLKMHQSEIICTSDSGIIDSTKSKIFDLPRHILQEQFNAEFLKLTDFI